ncbi:MAG TPA: HypC/HybG/HupF family hydrogenase formation chaperone [Candidatus Limnocylindrales bacterium]
MCLGIPGKVIEVRDDAGLRMGRVDFGGVRKEACLSYVPDVALGDYVVVHVGFAISKVDEEEALRTLELLSHMGDLVQQELATMGPGMAAPAVVDEPASLGADLPSAGPTPSTGPTPSAGPAVSSGSPVR